MTDKEYHDLFDYNDGSDILPEGAIRISPSGVEKFFSDKTTWYRENLLGEAKKFTGSTSTVLGTCVHAVAEIVANGIMTGVPHDSDEMHDAIQRYIDEHDEEDGYDVNKISALWKPMAEPLVRDFVVNAHTVATEEFIYHELLPGIFVAGSYDAITSTAPNDDLYKPVGQLTVRDYKTASKMPSSFTYAYKLQAYTYAYILHQKGIKVSYVELCFAVQPTKTMGVRTKQFVVPFDNQAYDFIEGILKLIADSIQCFNDYADLQYLLACDYRLKKNDIPRPE